jgi:hypothetical protein
VVGQFGFHLVVGFVVGVLPVYFLFATLLLAKED